MKNTDISKKTRAKVLDRDSIEGWPCCIYCGRPADRGYGLHLHHIRRRSQGGEGSEENLVTLCFDCHSKLHSGDKDIQSYAEKYLEEKYEGMS